MNKNDLSIVISAYNVEKFLPMCIDSLLRSEGISDTEIIIVDDGSEDETGKKAGIYAAEYPNVEVIHKANQGPFSARNEGLKKASGKYVFFCDSDDMTVPENFSKIISKTSECDADIIMWKSTLIDEEGNLLDRKDKDYFALGSLEHLEKTYTGKEIIKTQIQKSGDYLTVVWLGTYRRDFLLNNNLFFDSVQIHEDDLWVLSTLLTAEKVLFIPETVYQYRIRKGSLTNPESEDMTAHVGSMMKVFPALYGICEKDVEDEELKRLLEANITKRYLNKIFRYKSYRYENGKNIDKKLLWKTAGRFKDKIRVMLLFLIANQGDNEIRG